MSSPDRDALVKAFLERAAGLGCKTKRSPDLDSALEFIAGFCREMSFSKIVVTPAAKDLLRNNRSIPLAEVNSIRGYDQAEAGVVLADYGIAETGSLVQITGSDDEKLAGILPRVCIAILESRKIVETGESLAAVISAHLSQMSVPGPQVSFISGPSRTADIENQLCIGVHGPSDLVLIVVDGAQP